jgi:hypothetical protein
LQVSERELGSIAVIAALVVEFVEPIPEFVIWTGSQSKHRRSCPESNFSNTNSIVLQRCAKDVLAQIQEDGEVSRLLRSTHQLQLLE